MPSNEIDVAELVRTANGFDSFNPMQQKALVEGLFDSNLVIASPTASGKTIIAELAGLDSILNQKKKAIYLAPLRALASEHYRDFKQKYASTYKVRFALSTGEYDSASQYLQNYDMIFLTNEKADSLLRHKAEWLSRVGVLIIDEVHLLGNDRGPTLEMVITQFRHLNPSIRIIALSATIPNSAQIAKWLSAKLVLSDYRPVPLSEGVLFDSEIRFGHNQLEALHSTEKEPILQIVHDTLHQKNKQALVFVNTRPLSQTTAKKISSLTEKVLSDSARKRLQKAASAIQSALEHPTEQCELLAHLVKRGVAFHHAGLVQKQRHIVESAFKKNLLKVICATPTLAAGVNTPAFRVIIPSVYRYGDQGYERISVSEYKQMSGRAGRPKFDSTGEAILLAKSLTESDELLEKYVNGKPEEIESKLGIEPVLRTHLLASVATGLVSDAESLHSFFSKTFYAEQFGKMDALLAQLMDLLEELKEMKFVEPHGAQFAATPLGKRVSELYLDPVSARELLDGLLRKQLFSPLSYLFLAAQTLENAPWITVPKKFEAEIFDHLQESKSELPIDFEQRFYSDPHFLRKFFLAELLEAWISELPENEIVARFNVQPGILRSRLLSSDWMVFSAAELCKLVNANHHVTPLSRLQQRLKHGVREELLVLTELRGIGRVRARRLWQNNVRSLVDLKKIDVVDLGRLIGDETAQKVKKQLESPRSRNRFELRDLLGPP